MGRSSCYSKQGHSRGAWTPMEDMILSEYIRIHGSDGWKNIAKRAGLKRCGKSCRLRWLNYLRPDIKRGNISPDEEDLIIRLHRLLGNRWSLIAGRLPGRTDNEIKNYWHTHMSKKLCLSMSDSQPKSSQKRRRWSKSPVPVPNPVFKATAVRIKAGMRLSGIVRENVYNDDGSSNLISDEAFRLCNVKETRKSSWSHLHVNDSMGDEESELIALGLADNPIETLATNRLSPMSSLADQQSPHYDHFGEDAATLAESSFYLNEKSSQDCNLLPSLSDCSTSFTSEELYREIVELYDNAEHEDWIHEFGYLDK